MNDLISNELVSSLVMNVASLTAIGQFPMIESDEALDVAINWPYAISIASILACGQGEASQEAALQLASGCLLAEDSSDATRFGASTVLDRLANSIAVDMARQRGKLPEYSDSDMSISARIQAMRLSLEYEVSRHDGSPVRVNKFQKDLFESLKHSSWISATASTSVGKSFAMGLWLAKKLAASESEVVIVVVPTRALIYETEQRLRKLLIQEAGLSVDVRSIPLPHKSRHQHQVFVFTQERLHLWLSRLHIGLDISTLIVDEAHKVGDGARGVLLQQALEMVRSRSPGAQVVFLSPSTSNPEVLLQDAPTDIRNSATSSSSVTVLQNLLWATQVPRHPKEWNLELIKGDVKQRLGGLKLPADPSQVSKRLPFVAFSLGDSLGGNIVYSNGAAEAEKYCKQLYDLAGPASEETFREERADLAELAKAAVHREYLLVQLVKRGVAYHYGNMPLILRTEIERLFEKGGIKYLVCTSTLVEGVNTACKSIFLRGPKKGIRYPMSESDFWNLAGRAGRWGREFQGNIVCVDARDKKVWGESLAPTKRSKYLIKRRAVELVAEGNELTEFIQEGAPRDLAAAKPELESTVAYLSSCLINGQQLKDLSWASSIQIQTLEQIERELLSAIQESGLSNRTIESNPGISVFAMRSLLTRFRESEHHAEELAPVLPSSEDAVKQYAAIFRRISQEMNPRFGDSKFIYAMATLTVNWMRGYPVGRLISNRIQSLIKRNQSFDVQAQIRKTLDLVEQFPRFLAPRYIACYCDVLRDHMVSLDMQDQADRILDVAVRLELGVSSDTQISLAGLGLSRTTSLAVSELIAADDLGEGAVLQWLSDRQWMTASLPKLVKDEIARCLELFVTRIR